MVRVATDRENTISSPNLSRDVLPTSAPSHAAPHVLGTDSKRGSPSGTLPSRRGRRMGELKPRALAFPSPDIGASVPRPPPPLLRSPPSRRLPLPPPRIPSPLEFHCKAKSGGWTRRRGALRWLWEDLPPRLCPPGGLAPTTTTRLFSTPPPSSGCRLHWSCEGDCIANLLVVWKKKWMPPPKLLYWGGR